MSARMQVPLSQRRHTNVAVVRYTKNGVKLEIACYKNKVISYRSGVETRMDEVLQVERVFTNVSRGLYASEKDIQSVFGKGVGEEEALQYILDHGELQIAQQERTAEIDQMFIDIAVIISQKCVNDVTQRPFPAQVIEQALRSIGAAVKLDQPVKKQALALIHQLIEAQTIPIARAQMKLRCSAPDEFSLARLVEWCEANGASILEKRGDTNPPVHNHSVLILLQPHLFREIEKFVKNDLPPGGTVHMIESAVRDVGEGDMMDTELIEWANAHATGTGGVGNVVTSHRSCGTESHADSGQTKKKGKKGTRKQYGIKRGSGGDDDDQHTTITADLSSTPGMARADSEELQVTLNKFDPSEMCVFSSDDDTDRKGKRGKKKAKRRQGGGQQQRQSITQKEVNIELQEGSDDEMLVNRKQRRKAANKANDCKAKCGCDDDPYEYSYMEDDENMEEAEEAEER